MRRVHLARGRTPILPLLLSLTAAACASSGSARAADEDPGAETSEAAVRGFLDAARVRDYGRMGAHFGTRAGPARRRFGVAELEQRMIFLAQILRHHAYELRVANLAQLGPDRVRFVAALRGTRRGQVDVPVVTVPAADGRWYVESLTLDALTAATAR